MHVFFAMPDKGVATSRLARPKQKRAPGGGVLKPRQPLHPPPGFVASSSSSAGVGGKGKGQKPAAKKAGTVVKVETVEVSSEEEAPVVKTERQDEVEGESHQDEVVEGEPHQDEVEEGESHQDEVEGDVEMDEKEAAESAAADEEEKAPGETEQEKAIEEGEAADVQMKMEVKTEVKEEESEAPEVTKRDKTPSEAPDEAEVEAIDMGDGDDDMLPNRVEYEPHEKWMLWKLAPRIGSGR